ncbi:MAG: hypothetical protein NT091_01360 [Candidatus Falkowbacteria bacterium]|nr:hypothetical protein [Candidatus Falkowbacteria bacterium]
MLNFGNLQQPRIINRSVSEEDKIDLVVQNKSLELAPKIEDFKELVGDELIALHKKKVKEIESNPRYNNQESEKGKLLEKLLAHDISFNDWLDGAFTVGTTRYDDCVNHTDFVIEWRVGEDVLRLAVDTTVSGISTNDPSRADDVIFRKTDYIAEEIVKGRGTTIQYLDSEAEDKKISVSDVPRVIIAFDHENMDKYIDLTFKALKKVHGYKEKLINNYLQISLLREMISQSERLIARMDMERSFYYKGEKKPYADSDIYKNMVLLLNHLRKIKQEKGELVSSPRDRIEVIPLAA